MRQSTYNVSSARSLTSHRRGGVVGIALAAVAVVSAGTVTAFSVAGSHTTDAASSSKASAANSARKLVPGEVAVVLHLLGLHPEGLAAVGMTGLDCDGLFDTGTGYCLQAERLAQLQLAHKNVNMASEKAVRPDAPGAVDGQGNQISLSNCQTALADLEAGGWTFVTTGLGSGRIGKLATIKANEHWGLPAPYLIVNRTDEEWLALRGALCARRYATQHGETLDPALTQILADVEGNATVAQALTDYAGGLASVQDSWRAHETP